MTDTSTNGVAVDSTVELPTLVGLMYEQWKLKGLDAINRIDEQLNTDGGAAALGRAAIEKLHPDTINGVTTEVTNMLSSSSPEELLAIVTLIRKAVRSVDPTVKAYVEANKTAATELSESENTRLREERKAAVDSANALRGAAKASDPSWAKSGTVEWGNLDTYFPVQENKRGSSGPRKSAPKLKGSFAWAIDGRPFTEGDTVALLAKKLGVSATDLKNTLAAYMAERGTEFDFANPPESFEFEYVSGDIEDPDGHTVYRISASSRNSDTDSDEDSDDDSFDEVTPEDDSGLFSDD